MKVRQRAKTAAKAGAVALAFAARREAEKQANNYLDKLREETTAAVGTRIKAWRAGIKTKDVHVFKITDEWLASLVLAQIPGLREQGDSLPMRLVPTYDYPDSSNQITAHPTGGMNALVSFPNVDEQIRVEISDEEASKLNKVQQVSFMITESLRTTPSLTITCYSSNARTQFIDFCTSLVTPDRDVPDDSPPKFIFTSLIPHQETRKPARRLESVFLTKENSDALSELLSNFKNAEERNAVLGRPHSIGIVLHGPPGSGKSSLCHAIASEHGQHMRVLAINSYKDDKEFFHALTDTVNHVIVLEDIDVFKKSLLTRNAEAGDGVSLGGLLNVLDGPMTPHNSIFILTTNDVEALQDEALMRPGRVDLALLLDYATDEQVRAAAEAYTEVPLDLTGYRVAPEVSMAQVTYELMVVPVGTSALTHLESCGILVVTPS